jgi:NAD(P)H-dependent FMN reductase
LVRLAVKLLADKANVIIYNGLGTLSHFDGSTQDIGPVQELRNAIAKADGVLISSPEYAFGVPGSLKNALDWTVSSGELVNKPLALITAATGGEHAHQSLLLTFKALSANIPYESTLLIPFIRSKMNVVGDLADENTIEAVGNVLNSLLYTIDHPFD